MAQESSYKRRLPAGIVDSSFASLATFVVGLAAVNLLEGASRGVYAVYFTAFLTGTVLARNLIFTPAEVQAVSYDRDDRLASLGQGLRLGILPGILGAGAALIAQWVTSGYADPTIAAALTITTAIVILLSPMQDHVRRMLHIAAHSWRAASVSMVQLVVVVAAVGTALYLDVPVEWVPFGSLAIANAASLAFGWILAYALARTQEPRKITLRGMAQKGKWLVGHASVSAATGFAVAALVAELADPETLGYAESARVVAQPVIVLAFGLSAVLAPRSMRAAMDTDASKARHTNGVYMAILTLAGAAYIAVAAWDWPLNPMAYIVPSAYVVSGLVAVQVVSNLASSALFLQTNEMLGGHKERTLLWVSLVVSPITLLGAATAGVTGAFARPISNLMGSTTRYGIQNRIMASVYAAGPVTTDETSESDLVDEIEVATSESADRP